MNILRSSSILVFSALAASWACSTKSSSKSSGASGGGGVADTGGATSTDGGSTSGGKTTSGGAIGANGGSLGVPLSAGAAGSAGEAGASATETWDWSGVVGTGQSLAVGQFGTPVLATTQPYNNLKLSTGMAQWPIDPNDTTFSMLPLTEPIGRPSTAYPSSYPTNIAGETPHASMANQITSLVQAAGGADYVGVHGEFGENGQCLTYLKKDAPQSGVNGRAYQATLLETQAITRLAGDAGKTYGIGAITLTHGECDAGNTAYESQIYQLWSDYDTDLRAITGQTKKPIMIVSQQNSINDRSPATIAEWRIGVDHPQNMVCSGPKYQYPYYSGDHVHLVTAGYEQLGEKYGQVYYERVVLGHFWQPLEPIDIERTSSTEITLRFHVPVPPLVWDSTFSPPHPSTAAWSNAKGFELWGASGNITISSVDIVSDDSVQITTASDLPASVILAYAMIGEATAMAVPHVGTFRWGLLRDSDPFVGAQTNTPQPNYLVAFQVSVP